MLTPEVHSLDDPRGHPHPHATQTVNPSHQSSEILQLKSHRTWLQQTIVPYRSTEISGTPLLLRIGSCKELTDSPPRHWWFLIAASVQAW